MQRTVFEDYSVTALGHAGFRISSTDEKVSFAFDPFEVKVTEPVDFIFVSHNHFDHCDPASIRVLLGPKTKVVAPNCCQKELEEFGDRVEYVSDELKHELTPTMRYWTLPAYNVNKFRTPGEVFHPKSLGGVGFIVELEPTGSSERKTRFYHAGDTDFVPEMHELKKIGVAFLPISGTFVMTLEEALEAAKAIQPRLAIPMHFGKLLGSVTDAHRFENLLAGSVPVAVLSTEPS